MLYTVKEVAALSNVTIKALHHYHKLGLLIPAQVSEAGYRLYSNKELERLQQILFYKELDLPLEQIKELMEGKPDRLEILLQQQKLLLKRKQRLQRVIETLEQSIASERKGETMGEKEMFRGFETEEKWREALEEQREHVLETYNVDLLNDDIKVEEMNEQAVEAASFMEGMARALTEGVQYDNEKVLELIRNHLRFMDKYGHPASPSDFAAQARFFLNDDFHRGMLEQQQTGLSYYLVAAAEAYANL